MLTVEACVESVERRLAGGDFRCPGECGQVLARWGYARRRVLRDFGEAVMVRPRRARCRGGGGTHVLLPVIALLRRGGRRGGGRRGTRRPGGRGGGPARRGR